MSFTEKYVSVAGAGAHDGVAEASAWTFAEMIAATPAAESRINMKAGSYSTGTITFPANGTLLNPIVIRGYNSTIGDLDNQGRASTDQTLTTTNFPVLTITGVCAPSVGCILQNISITGALSSALISSTTIDTFGFVNCKIVNTTNNAAARAVIGDNDIFAVNCDFSCTGAAHASVFDCDLRAQIVGCRFSATAGNPCLTTEGGIVSDSVFGGGSLGIQILALPLATNAIVNCTFYNFTTAAIQTPNTAMLGVPIILANNHVTDCAKYLDGLYTATDETPFIEMWNRTRDNTTPRTGILSVALGGEVTTDAGDNTTDYTSASGGDFELISTAAGYATGMIPFRDIGAIQHANPAGGSGGLLTHPGMAGRV